MNINQEKIIEFKNVTFSYTRGKNLFKNLSLAFHPGMFFLIKGTSGMGKSSLLKLINRIEDPQKGVILFKGRPQTSYKPQVLRRSIIYIQQTPILMNSSVKDNLLLPFSFKANSNLKKPDNNKLSELLETFSLNNVNLSDHAQNLSVGQRQRICLIRGLLLLPEVILLDEPTSALDEESTRIVESSIARLCWELGKTVIMVSHKKFEYEKITPVVLELLDGQIKEI